MVQEKKSTTDMETKPADSQAGTTPFEQRLMLVAKELERFNQIRQSRDEFMQEMSAAPEGRPKSFKSSENRQPDDESCDLEMACEIDTAYDVDEVRYQNFLARNRITSRSNVIKTLVYRVPESAYVVKKIQVFVDGEPLPQEKTTTTTTTTASTTKLTTKTAPPKTQKQFKKSPEKKPVEEVKPVR